MPRKSDDWMEQLDERVLEHLADEGVSTPRVMASRRGFGASEPRVAERCRMLADAGFVAPVSDRTYEITTWGLRYLSGQVDARHQPTPRPDREGG